MAHIIGVVSPCAPKMQGYPLRGPHCPRIMGIVWHRCMATGSIQGPLLLQFINVPKTWAYRISGSMEFFPQHCLVPYLSPIEHLKALTAELVSETTKASSTIKIKGKTLLKILCTHLDELVMPSSAPTEQRVPRVPTAPTTSPTLPLVLQKVSDSPAIMQTWDPTAKQNLIETNSPANNA